MKTRLYLPCAVALALLVTALSTGSRLMLAAALAVLLLTVSSWVAVRRAAGTLTLQSDLGGRSVRRGEDVDARIAVGWKGLLPVAPVGVRVSGMPGTEPRTVYLEQQRGRQQELSLQFHAAHIGACTPGVERCEVEDLFGIFRAEKKPTADGRELLVLPVPFDVEDVPLSAGESAYETIARATEDVTDPADFRGYQPGDSLKKIHWKLTMRKQELVVRRFEEPVMPDTLLLLDCSAPPVLDHPEAEADQRDCLLETAASVMQHEIRAGHEPRLPLYGAHPVECEKSMGMPAILEKLARVDFSEAERFERMLLLETRRMRKTGAVVVIAARLNSRIADVLVRIRRIGPYVRLYFVTFAPDDPQMLPLVARLQRGNVDVRYVQPSPA